VPNLAECVEAVGAKARKHKERGLGEQNTKAAMVEPVLEALGWDIRDPEEVHREYRPTGRDSPVDYALKLLRKPRLYVEAKGLGESITDRKWVTQVLGYAIVAGVEWCVLTDGDEYRFYNATAAVDAEEKMFCSVRLTAASRDDAVGTLSLLSRANLEQNLLDTLWISHFVDRRVKTALREMLATPSKAVLKLVRQQVPKLSPKEITESIRRLDIRIESPAFAMPRPAAVKAPTSAKPAKSRKKARAHKASFNASLGDLIGAGLLKPPVRLFRKYKGHMLEATLESDGSVTFGGTAYKTCSTAAEVARSTVTGRKMNTNGWSFWQFEDGAGKKHELDTVRKAYLAANSGAAANTGLRLTGRQTLAG
jgi:predicted type IV restriction endonuclease